MALYMIFIYSLIERIFHHLDMLFHQILLLRQNSQDIPIHLLNYAEYYSVIQPEKFPPPPHTHTHTHTHSLLSR